jgi:hypothetical protein
MAEDETRDMLARLGSEDLEARRWAEEPFPRARRLRAASARPGAVGCTNLLSTPVPRRSRCVGSPS